MDTRAKIQEMFRAANESLRDRLVGLEANGRTPFICECDDADCMQVVDVPLTVYEQARTDGRFLLRPGHGNAERERVVDGGADYILTEPAEWPSFPD